MGAECLFGISGQALGARAQGRRHLRCEGCHGHLSRRSLRCTGRVHHHCLACPRAVTPCRNSSQPCIFTAPRSLAFPQLFPPSRIWPGKVSHAFGRSGGLWGSVCLMAGGGQVTSWLHGCELQREAFLRVTQRLDAPRAVCEGLGTAANATTVELAGQVLVLL